MDGKVFINHIEHSLFICLILYMSLQMQFLHKFKITLEKDLAKELYLVISSIV